MAPPQGSFPPKTTVRSWARGPRHSEGEVLDRRSKDSRGGPGQEVLKAHNEETLTLRSAQGRSKGQDFKGEDLNGPDQRVQGGPDQQEYSRLGGWSLQKTSKGRGGGLCKTARKRSWGTKENAQQSRAVRLEPGGPKRKGTFGSRERAQRIRPSEQHRTILR